MKPKHFFSGAVLLSLLACAGCTIPTELRPAEAVAVTASSSLLQDSPVPVEHASRKPAG